MNDKTEFSRIVPAMIQDKAADWLFGKLDEELDALREFIAQGEDATKIIPGSLKGAAFRGQLIHETLIALYADEKESTETKIGQINIEKLE